MVYEEHPTYTNLMGRVEHVAQLGALVTHFQLIKPGALHRANGGYLLLDAYKLLTQPFAWDGLKRALSSRVLRDATQDSLNQRVLKRLKHLAELRREFAKKAEPSDAGKKYNDG